MKLLNGPVDQPWGVRGASFSDPGGDIWKIAKSGFPWYGAYRFALVALTA